MPPADEVRPPERAFNSIVPIVEASLDHAATLRPNPGRTLAFRRLNRTEYQNAIRDLLSLSIDTSTMLPNDDSSHGFDNITVGDLSPTLLDRYITAAERISRLAIGSAGRSPGGDTIRVRPDVTQEEHVEGLPIGTRGGTLIPYTFPQDGEYEIQVRLARDRNEHLEGLNEPHESRDPIGPRAKSIIHGQASKIGDRSSDGQCALESTNSGVGRPAQARRDVPQEFLIAA